MSTEPFFHIIDNHIFYAGYKDKIKFIKEHPEAIEVFNNIISIYDKPSTQEPEKKSFKNENLFTIEDDIVITTDDVKFHFDLSMTKKTKFNKDDKLLVENSLKIKLDCSKNNDYLFGMTLNFETKNLQNSLNVNTFLSLSFKSPAGHNSTYMDITADRDNKLNNLRLSGLPVQKNNNQEVISDIINTIRARTKEFITYNESSFIDVLSDKQLLNLFLQGKVDKETADMMVLFNDSNGITDYVSSSKSIILDMLNKNQKIISKKNI